MPKKISCTLLTLCTVDLREGRLLRQCFQYRSVIFSNLDTAALCTGRLEGHIFSIWFMAHIYDTILHTWISLAKIPYTTQYDTLECLSENTQYDTLWHTWIYLWYLWRWWPEVFVRGPGGGLWAIFRPLLRICQMLFTGSRLNPKAVKNNIFLLPKKTVNWKDFQHWEDGRPCLHFQHKHPAQSKRHQSISGYFAYTCTMRIFFKITSYIVNWQCELLKWNRDFNLHKMNPIEFMLFGVTPPLLCHYQRELYVKLLSPSDKYFYSFISLYITTNMWLTWFIYSTLWS